MDAGPLVVGCETACWNAVVLRVLSWRKCGVLYKLLPNLGFAFQKARFVSAHLDAAQRLAWLQFSVRLFFQDIEGRFNSESYQAFLQGIMAQTMEHLFLINEGARDHPSAATQAFGLAHSDRLTEYPLPSYSPDYHPIEYLWKKTKQRATDNKYFKEWATLTVSVGKALAYFAMHSEEMLGLFGRYCEESGLELKQAA